MPRVLVVTDERLGAVAAGPAIRAIVMASHLHDHGHEVKLRSTAGGALDDPPAGIDAGTARAPDTTGFEELVAWADIVVFGGFLLVHHPWIRERDVAIVVDLYDPLHLEVLAAGSGAGMSPPGSSVGADLHRLDTTIDAVQDQLGRADFVLCASERQRDLYIGHLAVAGRLNAVSLTGDPGLRQLIDCCPFGIPAGPPAATSRPFSDRPDLYGENARVALWAGGVHDWFDPVTAIDAVAAARSAVPGLQLVFLGGAHPTHGVSERLAEAQAYAERNAMVGTVVHFNEGWVPPEERHNYLLDAAVGISTHREHLETEYAYRTRLLDHLWCGLPTVASRGDQLAEGIEAAGAGVLADSGDAGGISRGLVSLLGDPTATEAASAAALDLANAHRWDRALEPLVRFCAEPKRAADLADPLVASMVKRRSALPGARARDLSRAVRVLRRRGGVGELNRRLRQRRSRS